MYFCEVFAVAKVKLLGVFAVKFGLEPSEVAKRREKEVCSSRSETSLSFWRTSLIYKLHLPDRANFVVEIYRHLFILYDIIKN